MSHKNRTPAGRDGGGSGDVSSLAANDPARGAGADARQQGKRDKSETLRRLKLGDVHRLIRHRFNRATLPNTDQARVFLTWLLLLASLAPQPRKAMKYQIEVWAEWAEHELEPGGLADLILQEPTEARWKSATPTKLGNGLRFTVTEWSLPWLRTKQIRPYDVDAETLAELRRDQRNAAQRERRRSRGVKPQAQSLSRTKPWEATNVSRATFYRLKQV